MARGCGTMCMAGTPDRRVQVPGSCQPAQKHLLRARAAKDSCACNALLCMQRLGLQQQVPHLQALQVGEAGGVALSVHITQVLPPQGVLPALA